MELHHPDGISVDDRGKELLHSFNDTFPETYVLELDYPPENETGSYDHLLQFTLYHNKPEQTVDFIQEEINRIYRDTELTVDSSSVVNTEDHEDLESKTEVTIQATELSQQGAHMKIHSLVDSLRGYF